MYAMTSAPRLAAIARSGVLNLHEYDVAEFSLDAASEAVAHAAMNSGPFEMTSVRIRPF